MTEWDDYFSKRATTIPPADRHRAGALLPMIPDREEWEEFLVSVRQEWTKWLWDLGQNPHCLLTIYEGTAFFYYEGGAFWDAFAQAVGAPVRPDPQHQTRINHEYGRVCAQNHLPLTQNPQMTLYVGSAVFHVGIPIKVWGGFLTVCEWAWYHEGWELLQEEDWKNRIESIVPGQRRLQKFLCQNRETAMRWIKEVHDVRRLLDSDPTATLADIAQAVFLRTEYFEEVPETADFLREKDPDSLFKDRPRLAWNRNTGAITVFLPAVAANDLPATWQLGERHQAADTQPREMAINSAAFSPSLLFSLQTTRERALPLRRRIQGLSEWALYDERTKRFVNTQRADLPLSSYSLISRTPLAISREGWIKEEDEVCDNLTYSFPAPDNSQYFVTDLLPEKNKATLTVEGRTFSFRQRLRVNLRIFSSTSSHRLRFHFSNDSILGLEQWPRIVAQIPRDFFTEEQLHKEFQVFVDDRQAKGKWCDSDEGDEVSQHFFWKWADPPLDPPKTQHRILRGLEALNIALNNPQTVTWLGRHEVKVVSKRLGTIPFGPRLSQKIEILSQMDDSIFPTNVGDALVWVLLTEVQDEATWEEIRIAHNELAWTQNIPAARLYYQLRKIEGVGMAQRRGRQWTAFENRIWFARPHGGNTAAKYAGLTSALYSLLRAVKPTLPIQIPRPERGEPPHLQFAWPSRDEPRLRQMCAANQIRIMRESLWTR